MLLRSTSTPVLGSLLSSFSDSPSRDFDTNNNKHHYPSSSSSSSSSSSATDPHLKRISFSHGGNQSFASFTCNSSPLGRSRSGFSDSDREGSRGFRRAQSDGNLEGLAAASCDFDDLESSCLKPPRRNNSSMLQSIPSLSIYNNLDGYGEDDDLEEENEEEVEMDGKDGFLERTVTIGDTIVAQGSVDFSFGEKMEFISEEERSSDLCYLGADDDHDEGGEQLNPPMFLARGLGMDVGGFGGGMGSGFSRGMFGEGGQDGSEIGEYYKKMVEENPCSSLFLRNYAQFLYKTKGDLRGADEYYSRAILADPQDGEILSQYAKLVWELHRDHERASSYFERAVQAAPEDSHVHAAYASFLWETEDSDEEESLARNNHVGMIAFNRGAMASANA